MSFNWRRISRLIVIVATLAAMSPILLHAGLPLHGDMATPLSMQAFTEQFSSMWDVHGMVSNMESVDRLLFAYPICWVLWHLGAAPVWAERVWIFACLLISGLGGIALAERVATAFRVKLTYERVIAALLYMFAPWAMESIQGPFLWIAYAVLPWFLVAVIDACEAESFQPAIAIRIAWFWTMGSMIPHTFVFFAVIGVVTVAAHARKLNMATISIVASAIAIFSVLNFYWLYITLRALSVAPISPGYAFTADQLKQFSRNATLLRAITGREEWVYWWDPPYWSSAWFLGISLVPTICAAVGFVLLKAWRTSIGIALAVTYLLFLAGILGYHDPLYRWLAIDAPGSSVYGWLLRGPGKLGIALPAFVSPFLAVTIALWKPLHWRRAVVVGLVVAATITSVAPKAIAYLQYYYVPVAVPSAYPNAIAWLAEHSKEGERTMELAPYLEAQGKNSLKYEASFDWNASRLAGNFIVRSLGNDGIGWYHFTSQVWWPFYEQNRLTKYSARSLSEGRIRYVLFHNDLVGAHAAGVKLYNNLRNAGLTRVASWGEVSIFENRAPLIPTVGTIDGRPMGSLRRNGGGTLFTFTCDHRVEAIRFALPADPYWALVIGGRSSGPPSPDGPSSIYRIACSQGEVGNFVYLPQLWLRQAIPLESAGLIVLGLLLGCAWITAGGRRKRVS